MNEKHTRRRLALAAIAFMSLSFAMGNHGYAVNTTNYPLTAEDKLPGFSMDSSGRITPGISTGGGENDLTRAQGPHGIAIGNGAQTLYGKLSSDDPDHIWQIAVGYQSKSNGAGATAIGSRSEAEHQYTTALGNNAKALYNGSTAVGALSEANGWMATSAGDQADALGNYANAFGGLSKANGYGTTAIGASAIVGSYSDPSLAGKSARELAIYHGRPDTAAEGGTAVGNQAWVTGNYGTALGSGAKSDQAGATALGALSQANGQFATAAGDQAKATANYANAFGAQSKASGAYSTASGAFAKASGLYGTAYGLQSDAAATGATAVGPAARASGENAVALGFYANASQANSVALGERASTSAAVDVSSATIGGTTYGNFAGSHNHGVVSVGNKDRNETRQIQNVSAGRVTADSTDAINGSQLYAVASRISDNDTAISRLSSRIGSLDSKINRVGAGAAALAALHPGEFNENAKWSFAAGYGNYINASAAAFGAYFRPTPDIMFSMQSTVGNNNNMISIGATFSIGSGNPYQKMNRNQLIRQIREQDIKIKAQDTKINTLEEELKEQNERIARLEKMLASK